MIFFFQTSYSLRFVCSIVHLTIACDKLKVLLHKTFFTTHTAIRAKLGNNVYLTAANFTTLYRLRTCLDTIAMVCRNVNYITRVTSQMNHVYELFTHVHTCNAWLLLLYVTLPLANIIVSRHVSDLKM